MVEESVGEELNTDTAALGQVSGRMVPSLTLIGKATEGIHTGQAARVGCSPPFGPQNKQITNHEGI